MQKLVKISGTLERMEAEKFSMIFMETRKDADKRPTKGTRWHLEDEERRDVALCGFALHGTCISVSPALAMFGTPCTACKTIVAMWLTDKNSYTSLMQSDVGFRQNVHRVVQADFFNVNAPTLENDSKSESKRDVGASARGKSKVSSPAKL